MISIIICSRTSVITDELKNNIANTIGVLFEIILIDNSDNKYSIFEAYNIGIQKSNYPFLCFMHDDILYHTNNWGQKVLEHFSDGNTGVIGVAGSSYYPSMPGSWWSGGLINEYIIPAPAKILKPTEKRFIHNNAIRAEVVVLDGVWICVRRTIFDKAKFDTDHFKGYHFYDIDISLQINKLGYSLFTVFDIVIQHFSFGNMNDNWLINAAILQKKWKKQLPVSCTPLSFFEACEIELKTLDEYIHILLYNHTAKKTIYKIVMKQVLTFYKFYLYYKTPIYLYRYLNKILKYYEN